MRRFLAGKASGVPRPFDALSLTVFAVAFVSVLATFRQYGIAWDEQGETVYGALLIKYYASHFQDHSAFEFVNFRFYGGGFELPAALLGRISPFGEYETRHLTSALLGLTGLVATSRLARALGGERAGALAAVLLALNPVFYGHMFINARDVPFATGMVCCLLLTVRALDELPALRARTAALFGLTLGLTMSVRVGGVLALLFFVAPVAVWLAVRVRSGVPRAVVARDAMRSAGTLLPALVLAYAVMAVFWPWAVQAPLNPLRALVMFSRFPFDGLELFEGKLVAARALPASYLPMLLVVKQPVLLLAGVACAVGFGIVALRRTADAPGGREPLKLIAVAFAAAFPILYFVVARPVLYNGMRHFLFVLPPMTVLAALGLDRALNAVRSRGLRGALAAAITLAGGAQLRALVALHPDQYVYFNALVGGARGAQGRYPLDYWGTSLAQATHRLVDELVLRDDAPKPGSPPYKVYVCGNVWSAASFFPSWLTPVEHVEDADFQIAIAQFYCKHPEGSRPVSTVTRDGAVLSYVDDLRPHDAEQATR
ncbi:MAG TPA: hypothetical protein VH062_32995 [Polyangiaceae bacterium]|jgi:hypothetical protein|nr:hypothetical protein [Polyangiaceae bacterium]